MNWVINNLIFFIIVFLMVYIFCYYIAGRIKVPKEKNKDKSTGKGKKQRPFKYTNEGKLMVIRYNLDEKKVDYQELLKWTSFCNAFVISLTCTIISNIPLKMYFQLALIYSIFEIVGRHLNKKWGKENE